MRIAIISSGFLPVLDGVSIAVFNRLQVLSQTGYHVLLLCPEYGKLQHIYPDWKEYTGNILPNINVVNLPSTAAIGLDFERDLHRIAASMILQELQAFQPDIIHVDEPERLAMRCLKIPGIDFAQRAQIPCVSFFHTNYIEYLEDYFPLPLFMFNGVQWALKKIFSSIYNTYDITLVSSRITTEKLIKMGIKNTLYAELLGFDSHQFQVQRNDAFFFDHQYQLSGLQGKTTLLFVGRLTPDKGWDFTLKALSQLGQVAKLDQIALLIAGEGPLRDQIAAHLGQISDHVYFLGRIPPAQMPALYVNSDIHVTTSEKETRGLTALEAFAAGTVVIAPQAGGLRDSIKDGYNGLLYTPQDQDDFIKKLGLLINNPTLRYKLSEEGKKHIEQYSWEMTVQRLLNIWKEQIEKYPLKK